MMRSIALAGALIISAAALAVGVQTAGAVPVFSADERAEGLRQGLGMGLATPADANGYPGPRHVLDSAETLRLTPQQTAQITALFNQMQAEAIPAAERLLSDEAALDQLFIQGRANISNITAASNRANASLAAVQVLHLKYHLLTQQILTPEQIQLYETVRARRSQASNPPTAPAENAEHAGHVHAAGMSMNGCH